MTDPVIYLIDDDDAAGESLEFLLASSQLTVISFSSATAFLTSLATAAASSPMCACPISRASISSSGSTN
jgi:FixJ family two-component response regulator